MATGLRDRLSMVIGDYLHSTVTTAIAASTSIVDIAIGFMLGILMGHFFW